MKKNKILVVSLANGEGKHLKEIGNGEGKHPEVSTNAS